MSDKRYSAMMMSQRTIGTELRIWPDISSRSAAQNGSCRLSPKDAVIWTRPLAHEDIFHYIYAVLYSPGYDRYVDYLLTEFPRLPLTSDRSLLRRLVELGADLVALHRYRARLSRCLVAAGQWILPAVADHHQLRRAQVRYADGCVQQEHLLRGLAFTSTPRTADRALTSMAFHRMSGSSRSAATRSSTNGSMTGVRRARRRAAC